MAKDPVHHDGSYRLLFQHPRMMRELIASCVDEEIAASLAFEHMEPLNVSFRSPRMDEREGDMLWRVPREDGEVYILLLLEFQSSPDPAMAFRILNYASFAYLELLRRTGDDKIEKVPPLLPVVLYNGASAWSAALNTRDMVALEEGSALERFQPVMCYHIVDEGHDALEDDEGAIELLFQMERVKTVEELGPLVDRLIEVLEGDSYRELRRDFATWMRESLLPAKKIDMRDASEALNSLEEVRFMLRERAKQWREQWKQEGLEEGREEGREEGEVTILLKLLTAKFGEDDAREERLRALGLNVLEQLPERILSASTEDEIFEDL